MSDNAYPKPMPPKRPLEKVEAETALKVIVGTHGSITREDLQELNEAIGNITPAEMHGVTVVKEKPMYVLKPHLTERPLKGHEGLEALKKQLEDSSPKRPQRRNNKEKK